LIDPGARPDGDANQIHCPGELRIIEGTAIEGEGIATRTAERSGQRRFRLRRRQILSDDERKSDQGRTHQHVTATYEVED
jgi:hypothetical protein